jgi:coiled-coil domain-containing protein 130
VIKTDPEHRDYAVVSGAKRKVEDYAAEDAQVIALPDKKEKKRLLEDPLYKLEHKREDEEKAKGNDDRLAQLELLSHRYENDYSVSRRLRKDFRKRKKSEKEEKSANEAKGIFVPMLPETVEDRFKSQQIVFQNKKPKLVKLLKKKKSIFK